MEKTSKLNQPVYFKDVLTSQWKPGDVLCWEKHLSLVSTGDEKLWIPSKLIKICFEKEKPIETEKWQLIHTGDNHTGGKKRISDGGQGPVLVFTETYSSSKIQETPGDWMTGRKITIQ